MTRILPRAFVNVLSLLVLVLVLLVGITAAKRLESESADALLIAARTSEKKPYSEVFPSLNDVVSMARLSSLVYKFGRHHNFTCVDFPSTPEKKTEDLSCEWYLHDYMLGTQVLLVSNKKEKYIAIVFAGTDDIRTSLEDTNILTKPFGNNSTVRLDEDTDTDTYTDQHYKKVKVHGGFNNAVFTNGIWEQIYSKTQNLLQQNPSYRLWTTGHSLGAANAMLTATAFASLNRNRKVLSVNFGCPQTGNSYWREYFNATSPLTDNLGIWRVVLSWDLVARLPEFFYRTYCSIILFIICRRECAECAE